MNCFLVKLWVCSFQFGKGKICIETLFAYAYQNKRDKFVLESAIGKIY